MGRCLFVRLKCCIYIQHLFTPFIYMYSYLHLNAEFRKYVHTLPYLSAMLRIHMLGYASHTYNLISHSYQIHTYSGLHTCQPNGTCL